MCAYVHAHSKREEAGGQYFFKCSGVLIQYNGHILAIEIELARESLRELSRNLSSNKDYFDRSNLSLTNEINILCVLVRVCVCVCAFA